MLAAIRAIGAILIGIVAKLMGPFGWLASIIVQPIIDWAAGAEAKRERAVADHEKAIAQAAQDNDKASKIDEGSKSDEVDSAIDDSLRHL